MEDDFFKSIIKEIGGEHTKLASDIDETERYIDTGSYIFNALISGSIYGGASGNKITALVGPSGCGKCARGTEKISVYCDELTAQKIKELTS